MNTEQIDKLLEILDTFSSQLALFIVLAVLALAVLLLIMSIRDFNSVKRNDRALQIVTQYRLGITNIMKKCPDEQMSAEVALELLDDIEKQLVSKTEYKFRKNVVYKESKK